MVKHFPELAMKNWRNYNIRAIEAPEDRSSVCKVFELIGGLKNHMLGILGLRYDSEFDIEHCLRTRHTYSEQNVR